MWKAVETEARKIRVAKTKRREKKKQKKGKTMQINKVVEE